MSDKKKAPAKKAAAKKTESNADTNFTPLASKSERELAPVKAKKTSPVREQIKYHKESGHVDAQREYLAEFFGK
jgi:hypothetical protein